jgi:6-phospho-3-hexuloisomerase
MPLPRSTIFCDAKMIHDAIECGPAGILDELQAVFARLDEEPLRALAVAVDRAARVVCAGQGRSGLVAAAFAVRLGHLGLDARVAGEASQPAVGRGDLVIALSRSGTTAITLHQAERARAAGAAVTAVIARPGSPLEAVADPVVILPATDTRQHGGSLFEQAALIAADAVARALQAARGLSDADLAARHDNLQ